MFSLNAINRRDQVFSYMCYMFQTFWIEDDRAERPSWFATTWTLKFDDWGVIILLALKQQYRLAFNCVWKIWMPDAWSVVWMCSLPFTICTVMNDSGPNRTSLIPSDSRGRTRIPMSPTGMFVDSILCAPYNTEIDFCACAILVHCSCDRCCVLFFRKDLLRASPNRERSHSWLILAYRW